MSRPMTMTVYRWLAAFVLGAAMFAAAAGERADTARELDAIQDRIHGLEREIARAASAQPTAGKALRDAELAEADARKALQGIRAQITVGRSRENQLRSEMARAEAELAGHRAALEWQLRLAYTTGREEWLRLALTQQDPVALSRRVVYYGYITRQRGALLEQVESEIGSLQVSSDALRAELNALADLSQRQEARVRQLSAARQVRATAVRTLNRDLGSRKQQVARLGRNARSLEELMARLERERQSPILPAEPEPAPGPAQHTRDLPLRGRMVARFGQPRAEGLLRWDGLVLAAPAGAEVHAVRGGRVVYSDWLPGLGLLLVIDHGKGYMSLYGHNQDLLKETGDSVRQGEVISRVGDSGGQGNPALYFEVRHNGKPVDPQQWVR